MSAPRSAAGRRAVGRKARVRQSAGRATSPKASRRSRSSRRRSASCGRPTSTRIPLRTRIRIIAQSTRRAWSRHAACPTSTATSRRPRPWNSAPTGSSTSRISSRPSCRRSAPTRARSTRSAMLQDDVILATARYWGRYAGHVLAEPMRIVRQRDGEMKPDIRQRTGRSSSWCRERPRIACMRILMTGAGGPVGHQRLEEPVGRARDPHGRHGSVVPPVSISCRGAAPARAAWRRSELVPALLAACKARQIDLCCRRSTRNSCRWPWRAPSFEALGVALPISPARVPARLPRQACCCSTRCRASCPSPTTSP